MRLKPAVSENVKQSKSEFVNNSNNKATLVPCVNNSEISKQGVALRSFGENRLVIQKSAIQKYRLLRLCLAMTMHYSVITNETKVRLCRVKQSTQNRLPRLRLAMTKQNKNGRSNFYLARSSVN